MSLTATFRQTRTLVFILVWVCLLLAWCAFRQLKMSALRTRVAALHSEQREYEVRINVAKTELGKINEQLRQFRAETGETLARAAQIRRELAGADAESFWSMPPGSPLEWDPESPYVWLAKNSLADIPLEAFTKSGELLPQIGVVFCLDPAVQQNLNGRLGELLANYRALETANAEQTDEHLPCQPEEPRKVTVRVHALKEQEPALKQQFLSILRQEMGEQRAELIAQRTGGWFDNYNQIATEPKVYSAWRTADGSYGVCIKTGSSWLSTSGFKNLEDYIPPHLLPLFAPISGSDSPDGGIATTRPER